MTCRFESGPGHQLGEPVAVRDRIGDVLLLAVVGAAIYALVQWDFGNPQGDEISNFAEKACVDGIRHRYDATRVSAYSINKTNNGYSVRASVVLSGGRQAKAYCLTNANGGVREIGIEEK